MQKEKKKHPDKDIVPAGMFYYQIQDPVLERKGPEEHMEDAFLEALRPRGIFNGEEQVVSLFQRETQEDGKSRWIPAAMKDGKLVAAKSSAVSREQFGHLRNFVYRRMEQFGSASASGDVAVKPYRRKGRTGCDYCEFSSVCGFDRKLPGYEYNRIADREPGEIWIDLAKQDEGR